MLKLTPVLPLLLMIFNAPLALASKAPANTDGDVFSATEDEMVVRNPEPLALRRLPVAHMIQHTPKNRTQVSLQKKQMAGIAAPSRPSMLPSESRSTVPALPEVTEFEQVPKDQLAPLAHRMNLVEEIMRRHSRAYDYRTHTIKELQDILAQLEEEASRAAATRVEPPTQTADEDSLPAPPAPARQ